MKKCEERQEKILQYMKDTIRERCFPPTVREICAALDIKSTSTVFKDLKVLEEKGLIRKDPSKPRALVVVDRNPPEPHNDIPTSIDDTNTKHYFSQGERRNFTNEKNSGNQPWCDIH